MVGFWVMASALMLSSILIALAKMRLPEYAALVTYQNLAMAFIMVLIIILFSSYLGIRKVTKIDPFDILEVNACLRRVTSQNVLERAKGGPALYKTSALICSLVRCSISLVLLARVKPRY